MVFNQGSEWECMWFSLITALSKQANLNFNEIIKEVSKDNSWLLSIWRANNIFKKYWIIEKVPRLKAKWLLTKWIPLVVRSNWIDWGITSKPPYRAIWTDRIGSHWFCIISVDLKTRLLKVQNTWWENWWDKGCFYLHADDLVKCSEFYKITPLKWDTHSTKV